MVKVWDLWRDMSKLSSDSMLTEGGYYDYFLSLNEVECAITAKETRCLFLNSMM